jgi:hypothetical protein
MQRGLVKKNRKDNVLPFRPATRPAKEDEFPPSTVIFQIGSTRFAIHMQYELLPPAPPRLALHVGGAAQSDRKPNRIVEAQAARERIKEPPCLGFSSADPCE